MSFAVDVFIGMILRESDVVSKLSQLKFKDQVASSMPFVSRHTSRLWRATGACFGEFSDCDMCIKKSYVFVA